MTLLSGEPHVITVGADLLGEALDAQAVPRTAVDWRPPLPGTSADRKSVV